MCFYIKITDSRIDWATDLVLDVDEQTNPIIEEYNENLYEGDFDEEIVYNISFPKTEKNYRVLNELLSGQRKDISFRKINVVAVYNGEPMNIDTMTAIGNRFNSESERFEVLLTKSKSWVKLSKERKISEIPMGFLSMTRSEIEKANNEGAEYIDDGVPWRFPFEENKKRQTTTRGIPRFEGSNLFWYSIDEMRPWVYALPLLREGFKSIGWSFKSPFLESSIGRRILTYILADDYNNVFPIEPLSVAFEALVEADIFKTYNNGTNHFIEDAFPFNVPNNPIYDRQEQFWVNGMYSGHCLYDMNVTVAYYLSSRFNHIYEFELTAYIGDYYVRPATQNSPERYIPDGAIEVGKAFAVSGRNEEVVLNLELNDIVSNNREKLFFIIKISRDRQSGGSNLTDFVARLTKYEINQFNIKKVFLQRFRYCNIQDIFNPDDTLFDYLVGISQTLFGKIEYNYNKREVSLYTPFDIENGDETIEGFYKKEIRNLPDILHQGTEILDLNKDFERYVNIRFAESDDKYIKSVFTEENFSLHGVYLDFGDTLVNQTKAYINEYFEPTYTEINLPNRATDPEYMFQVNTLVVGEDDRKNIKTGRRIILAVGKEPLTLKWKAINRITNLEEEFEKLIEIPHYSRTGFAPENPFWAFQSFDEGYIFFPEEVKFWHLSFNKIGTDKDKYDTLYKIALERYVNMLRNNEVANISAYLTGSDYVNWSKRFQLQASYKDHVLYGYPRINSYKPCSGESAKIELLIENNGGATAKLLSVPDNSLIGNPEEFAPNLLTIVKDGCTYWVEFNGERDGFDAEYFIDDGVNDDYEDYDNETGIVNPTGTIYVYMDVDGNVYFKEFLICDAAYTSVVIDMGVIDTVAESSYELSIVGVPDDDIDGIEWTVLEDDDEILYSGERTNTDAEKVCVSAVVTLKCGCGEIVLPEICFEYSRETEDCTNDLGIDYDVVDGSYRPVALGEAKCCVATDFFMWKTKEDEAWEILRRHETIYANEVWFKRVVTFCNNVCPAHCSELKITSDES